MGSLFAVILGVLYALPMDTRPCGVEDPVTCWEYTAELVTIADRVEEVTSVPAEMLIAVALVETQGTLRRDRHGRLGQGLMGINPRSPQYAYALALCDLHPEHCLETQVAIAAAYLRYERRRCGRGWAGALHSYGTGQCWGVEGGVRYASMVRRRERRVVGGM